MSRQSKKEELRDLILDPQQTNKPRIIFISDDDDQKIEIPERKPGDPLLTVISFRDFSKSKKTLENQEKKSSD